MTWKHHVDESAEGRHYIVLGRDLLTTLIIDINISKNVIIGGAGPYEVLSAPMAAISNYGFKSLTYKTGKP